MNVMNYYFWVNGYENAGVVKANSLEEAKHKVIMSQGECKNVSLLDNETFDEYDVVILII
ncbi:MAG: hypothetical protein QM266_08315 [Bacillota bacterium]|jgi:hypothetical protein|nr:hypothetical protein [Bacillota bacterium]